MGRASYCERGLNQRRKYQTSHKRGFLLLKMKDRLPEYPHPLNIGDKIDLDEVKFCQEGSSVFNQMIDDDPLEDWRSVRARESIRTGRDPDSRSPVYMGGKAK